jgi:hypothetical protein
MSDRAARRVPDARLRRASALPLDRHPIAVLDGIGNASSEPITA